MADIVESKTRTPKTPKPTKLCLNCGRVRDLESDYYTNRDWQEQLGKDLWCKHCVGKCATKEDIKKYFWENHREWNDRIWEIVLDKAKKALNTNITYQRSSETRQKAMLERLAAQQVPSVMGTMYRYVENGKDGQSLTYEDAISNGEIEQEENEDEKVYSDFFDGYFTKRDIEYLNNYYEELDHTFQFDNANLCDYAKKVCKASLQANKAQNDYAAGRCQLADVKDAVTLFDMLSKSANFAACKRKAQDTGNLTSWSETTLRLMTDKKVIARKIEWPEDDVDRVINNLRHTVTALGLDGI